MSEVTNKNPLLLEWLRTEKDDRPARGVEWAELQIAALEYAIAILDIKYLDGGVKHRALAPAREALGEMIEVGRQTLTRLKK